VVLGAGFTGLAAARRLAEHRPEARIVLLEAQRVGFGASGRNSGFVVDVGHSEEGLDLEANRRLIRLARAGIAQLRGLVEEHAIDCAWTEAGRLHGAVEDSGMRCLERLGRRLDELGEPYQTLDAEAVTALTGTRYYRAAVRTAGTVLVQPAALVRGLAGALPGNVELFEESPVRALQREEGVRLECAAGSVTAKHLLLASNGFTPALGVLRRRMFPLLTYASLTRPLRDEELAALGGQAQWGLVPEDRLGTTVRRTRDHRLLIRNGVRYDPALRSDERRMEKVRRIHRKSFRARFPALQRVEFEYTWGGVLGASLNDAQFFGRVAADVFASVSYNGVGVALGTVSGALLADLAVGCPSELLSDLESLPGPAWIPPDPLLGIGIRLTLGRLRARAGREL
jgi:glycine/D-amino acid oxidase-like deaminating enzyme